ncbi:DUF6959 family protein [Nocardia sp. NPDC058497]|uniref:DUF6959 family protein n=1 Tax=Nocardia sp. NPDC058497 TaxID=3346529 RepID=UPI003669422E
MDHIAELLDTEGDYSLVRWTGRRFPGLLLQGDSLSILVSDLRELKTLLSDGEYGEASFSAREILERVEVMQRSYENMMKNVGIKLPYAAGDA